MHQIVPSYCTVFASKWCNLNLEHHQLNLHSEQPGAVGAKVGDVITWCYSCLKRPICMTHFLISSVRSKCVCSTLCALHNVP